MGNLIIYQNARINEGENFIIDDIDDYLLLCHPYSFSNTQYIKTGLDVVVKASANAFEYEVGSYQSYNYAVIENTNTALPSTTPHRAYYFIRNIRWKAQNTIEFVLHLDVLNTYKWNYHYQVNNKTVIQRQHKNRFNLSTYLGKHIPVVDLYNEGINPKLYRHDNNRVVIQDKIRKAINQNVSFYLIYRNSMENNENTSNVVNCFLTCSKKLKMSVTTIATTFRFQDLIDGQAYYFFPDSASSLVINYSDSTSESLTSNQMLFLRRLNQLVRAEIYTYATASTAPYDNNQPTNLKIITKEITNFTVNTGSTYYVGSTLTTERNQVYVTCAPREITSGAITTTVYPLSYDEINKTDSRLIKIIKIPYIPTAIGFTWDSVNQELVVTSPLWIYDESNQMLRFANLDETFIQNTLEDDGDAIYPLNDVEVQASDVSLSDIHSYSSIEPKIYNSEFYQIKYMYDSFSKVIALEEVTTPLNKDLKFTYQMTRTINSRFMFYFDTFYPKFPTEDYYEPLIIQRNNEEVLYSSPYINYIRNGFNYDVKGKNREEGWSWFRTGLTIAGGILSTVFGSKTLGVALIASSVASLGSAIHTTISAEQNLESKMHQLKWQQNSVYGADDVDLMTTYATNSLLRTIYKVSPRMEKMLRDLFHYTGYIDSVMEVPDVKSRIWFNFLQCDLKVNYWVNVPVEAQNEIIARFKGGVTFFHKNVINNANQWDLGRSHENWESYFFN